MSQVYASIDPQIDAAVYLGNVAQTRNSLKFATFRRSGL